MTKISKLTKEQEAQIPIYIDKWINKASEPIDREKSVRIAKELFGEDKTILIAESIQNAIDIVLFISKGKKLKYDPQLDSQLYSQLRSQLYSQLNSQLDSQNISYSCYTTYFWYSWYGYYDFAKSIGVEFDEEKFTRMGDIILNIPIIISLGEILIVVENPKCRWENKNLHSDEFPAIEWKDNTGIYFLNAVRFEKELWENVVSRKMSLKEVMSIKDIDQRTQAMKYVNVEELISQFDGKILDTHRKIAINGEEINYKLVFIPKHKDLFTIDSYHAIYNCPSTSKVYMSGIDPKIGEKSSIKEAMAWKSGISIKEWETLVPLVTES